MPFFVHIQFLIQPHCQTETGDEAVDGQILSDLVFAVNYLQNLFSFWFFQFFNEFLWLRRFGFELCCREFSEAIV